MAVIPVQSIDPGGMILNYTPVDVGGDSFLNAKGVFLQVRNTDASAHTLTIAPVSDPIGVPGLGIRDLSDITLAVDPNEDKFLAVPGAYVGPGGFVDMTYDAVGLAIAVINIER